MCIRDRLGRSLDGAHGDADVLVGVVGVIGRWRGRWRGHRAVSYTHLRAHETVLDLVCRLLLEKKKQS